MKNNNKILNTNFLIKKNYGTLKFLMLLIILLFISSSVFSQNKIMFEFDYARFNIDSTNKYLEIYYSIGQQNLKEQVINNKSYVGAYLTIKISDSVNKKIIVDKKYTSKTLVVPSDTLSIKKKLLGVLGYTLPIGEYQLNITATAMADSTNNFEYTEKIIIKKNNPNKYAISDIQLATRIISNSQNKESIFYKNTMEVFPNPEILYTEKMPILFFYSELYNLTPKSNKKRILTLVQQLSTIDDKTLDAKYKTVSTINNSIVEAGVINLKDYPTGKYILSLSLFEDSSEVGVSSSKRFFLFNPKKKGNLNQFSDNKLAFISSEFGIMSEEECDELFLKSQAIMIKSDTDTYNSLKNVDGKREFLFKFWGERDQEPATNVNEFKDEYLKRVQYVEHRFKTFVSRGINTDRGRVYLQYGEPDEIDNFPNEHNMKPYEMWLYHNIEGGVLFVFGDVSGYGNYELLHSTKRGELRDDYWRRRITVD